MKYQLFHLHKENIKNYEFLSLQERKLPTRAYHLFKSDKSQKPYMFQERHALESLNLLQYIE